MNMTTIKKVEKILKDAGIEEYKAEARLIVEEISNLSLDKILAGEKIENEEKIISVAQKRAKTRAPIQHILGYAYFAKDKYMVNENVLIPRDETEILVEESSKLLKENIKNDEKINILDIGTGSGCIACALAKKLANFDIEILAVDISTDAIKTALENASKLDLIRKIIFRKSDVFSKIRDFEKFNLIVSNPPYIPLSEKENLQREVRDFDPSLALFTKDDKGLEFYERIIKDAPKFLKTNGFLAFECGMGQSRMISELLIENEFKNIKITKDLAGIDRVITAQK